MYISTNALIYEQLEFSDGHLVEVFDQIKEILEYAKLGLKVFVVKSGVTLDSLKLNHKITADIEDREVSIWFYDNSVELILTEDAIGKFNADNWSVRVAFDYEYETGIKTSHGIAEKRYYTVEKYPNSDEEWKEVLANIVVWSKNKKPDDYISF